MILKKTSLFFINRSLKIAAAKIIKLKKHQFCQETGPTFAQNWPKMKLESGLQIKALSANEKNSTQEIREKN